MSQSFVGRISLIRHRVDSLRTGADSQGVCCPGLLRRTPPPARACHLTGADSRRRVLPRSTQSSFVWGQFSACAPAELSHPDLAPLAGFRQIFPQSIMPMAFANIPGLAGFALVIARAAHNVICTGPSAVIATFIPEFRAIPQPAGNAFAVALPRIMWLLLAIIRVAPGFPLGSLLVASMIHVQRLGAAFEACIAAGLNTSACSASVARKRIRRKAAELIASNPGGDGRWRVGRGGYGGCGG